MYIWRRGGDICVSRIETIFDYGIDWSLHYNNGDRSVMFDDYVELVLAAGWGFSLFKFVPKAKRKA